MLATIALVLACEFSFGCKTMRIVQYANATEDLALWGIVGRANSSWINETLLEIGPWSWLTNDIYRIQSEIEVFEVCRLYSILENSWGIDGTTVDSLTQAIRAFTVIVAILSGVVVMYMCVTPCRPISRCRWRMYGVVLLCCSVFQGLCLLMPVSDLCRNNPIIQTLEIRNNEDTADTFPNECVPDVGYRCGIAATATFFVTGIVMLIVKPPRKVDDENWCLYEDNSYYMSMKDAKHEAPDVHEVKRLMASEANNNNTAKQKKKTSPAAGVKVEVSDEEDGGGIDLISSSKED